jgi:CRISPR-associated endoribonuclease Cas6
VGCWRSESGLHAQDQQVEFSMLVVYPFRLILELAEGRHTLPVYLGSTIRGIFASSFRRLVCVTRAPTCEGCLLLRRCSYPYLFETPAPSDLPEALQKRFKQAPRPYVLDLTPIYHGEPILELGLVLVGRAIDFLPYIIYVLDGAGREGIGRRRVPYRLLCVTDGSRDGGGAVFRAEDKILRDEFSALRLEDMEREGDDQIRQVCLQLLTPLRVKKYDGYQDSGERITFATLIDFLLGCLEVLSLFHCGGGWAPDRGLRELAGRIEVVAKDLRLQRLERYSNRHQQKLPLHGMVGQITFAGDLAPFLPLLRLGEFLHIGAGTAFGLGRYKLLMPG